MLKDAPGALADFEVAIKLSPKSAHIYFNRGNLYTSLQIYDQAEQDYTKGNVYFLVMLEKKHIKVMKDTCYYVHRCTLE